MKGIVIFFNDDNSKYSKDIVFNGKSALDLAENWAKRIQCNAFTLTQKDFSDSNINIINLLTKMKEISLQQSADYIIFSYKDLPFLKADLTEKMIENHTKYQSEYTFADGFPYGFAPEILDCGCLEILLEMLKTTKADFSDKRVARDCIYELIKSDINSFEVETVLSDSDWRLFRYSFNCGKKENFLACKALFDSVSNQNKNIDDFTADKLSEIASKNPEILKTVPAFFNLQICDNCSIQKSYSPYFDCYEKKYGKKPDESSETMDFDNFSSLIDKINVISENAVIGLSAWGEPLKHPQILKFIEKILSYKGLSVFIETEGVDVTDEFCDKLRKLIENAAERTNGWGKVMIAVSLDSVSDDIYKKIRKVKNENTENFGISVPLSAVSKLEKVNPGNIYPEFVRINENECELESFFRFWNDKNNITGGRFIIEKFNDFSKLLPECKPADLSPLERNICWHLRRDLTILSNGNVPSCYNCIFDEIIGNVFDDGLEAVWKKQNELLKNHICENYCERCRNCDEFYTFNF